MACFEILARATTELTQKRQMLFLATNSKGSVSFHCNPSMLELLSHESRYEIGELWSSSGGWAKDLYVYSGSPKYVGTLELMVADLLISLSPFPFVERTSSRL